jgi:hypothetical protein
MLKGLTAVSVLLFLSVFMIVMHKIPLFYALVIAAATLLAIPMILVIFLLVHGIVSSVAFLLNIDPAKDE